jgi:nucleotide-binding universal stress UspA family protein
MLAGDPLSGAMAMQLPVDEIEAEVRGILERAAEPARAAGVKVETHSTVGSPAEMLCETADTVKADLLVVGNRGMQGGRRFLGSVPNTVSHHAHCSVLIVDTQHQPPED